jgi:hypothetical protein
MPMHIVPSENLFSSKNTSGSKTGFSQIPNENPADQSLQGLGHETSKRHKTAALLAVAYFAIPLKL